jgi:hypothetical protein
VEQIAVASQHLLTGVSGGIFLLALATTKGRWRERDWVLWCQGLLFASALVASVVLVIENETPLSARDFVRIYAVRPEIVLVQVILWVHAGRRRKT